MGQLIVDTNLLQKPLSGDYIRYKILADGLPLVYDNGLDKVDITFEEAEGSDDKVVGGFNISNLNNTASSYTGQGVDGTVTAVKRVGDYYYVGGMFSQYNGVPVGNIIKVGLDGTLDTTFQATLAGQINVIEKSTTDAAIMVGGKLEFYTTGQTYTNFAKLSTTTGQPTADFIAAAGADELAVNTLTLLKKTSGTQYYLGTSSYSGSSYPFMVRINDDFTVDNTFVSEIPVGTAYDMDFLSGGDIVVVGQFSYSGASGVYYLNSTGGTQNSYAKVQLNNVAYTVSKAFNSNDIYVGGRFTTVNSSSSIKYLTRIDPAGIPDFSYQTAIVPANSQSYPRKVISVSGASGQELYVFGVSGSIGADTANGVTKLNQSGTRATGFNASGRGYNGLVLTGSIDGGNLVTGGNFSLQYSGVIPPTDTDTKIYFTASQTLDAVRTKLFSKLSESYTLSGVSWNLFNGTIKQSFTSSTVKTATLTEVAYGPVRFSSTDNTQTPYNGTVVTGPLNTFISGTIVLTRSPHFFRYGITAAERRAEIKLKMFTGIYTNASTLPVNYQITKTRITATQPMLYVDVSQLAGTFIHPSIDRYVGTLPTTSASALGLNDTTWINSNVTIFNASASTGTYENKYLALDGYGYMDEGANPTPPRILMTGQQTDIAREMITGLGSAARSTSRHKLYFNTENLVNIERKTDAGVVTQITFTGNSENNTTYIQMLQVTPTGSDKYVDYTFYYMGSSVPIVLTKRFNIMDECLYDYKDIHFKNRWGIFQTMTFFKRNDRSVTVERKSFERSTLSNTATFDPRRHVTTTYLVDASEEFTLNSGFVQDYMNDVYQELILSDEIYMNDSGTIKPVNIVDTSWTEKEQINDNLINYTLKVKVGRPLINNII